MKELAMDNLIEQIREGAEVAGIVQQLLTLETSQLEATINSIVGLKNEKAATILALFSEKAGDKKVRKFVKKALFHLKTQGIHIEEPVRTDEPSILRKVETDRESTALLSNYDPEQTRALVTAVELKKNEFVFTQGVIHFSKGLIELHGFPVRRKKLDSIFREYQDKTHRPMIVAPISAPYAGYLIEEASRISGKELEEARSLAHLLHSPKGAVRRPEDIYRLPAPSDSIPSSMASVLGDEMFETFLPAWSGMEEDRKRMSEATNPSIVLPPHLIQERREAFLKELFKDERVASKAGSLKRMFEDTAYLFYSLNQFDHYKGLLAILEDPQAMVAALVYFVQKTLSDLDRKAQQQQAPGVLVDPHSLIRK
jgi:hypothetical protein